MILLRRMATRGFALPPAFAIGAMFLLGCEDQFHLRVKSDADVKLYSGEHVERVLLPLPLPADRPHLFDDVGVRLASGEVHGYWREGDWVSSTSRSMVVIDPKGSTEIDFSVRPGRHDVHLELTVPTSSICELRRRRRPRRDVALVVGSIGAVLGVAGGVSALADPHPSDGAKNAEVGALVGGGALLLVGAAMFFWPAGDGRVDLADGC